MSYNLTERRNKFFSKLKEFRPGVEILSPFITQNHKIKYKCECGTVNTSTAFSLLNSATCRKCNKWKTTIFRFNDKIYKCKNQADAIQLITKLTFYSENTVYKYVTGGEYRYLLRWGVEILRVGDTIIR